MGPEVTAEGIRGWIESVVAESPENRLGGDFGEEPVWGAPLVGFAAGEDPLFERFLDPEVVDPRHFTPEGIFRLHFPDRPAGAEELTVISWVLPQTERTRAENRGAKRIPSERWLRAKQAGEAFNNLLRDCAVEFLAGRGVDAVAPLRSPHYGSFASDRFGWASSWSERHVAHACGLGTFGLSDGLITPLGVAVRLGSVVARLRVPPTPRPYRDHREYCLYYRDGSCRACLRRCPVGSIRTEGRDKRPCSAHLEGAAASFAMERWGLASEACGLCQVGVPCERGIPGTAERPKRA
jgi:epoxyqueuosine reductase QueG